MLRQSIIAALLIALFSSAGIHAQAQGTPAQQCFVVADSGDALWEVDPVTGISSRIGSLGASFANVEAIALNLDSSILYGAHDDSTNGVWGSINTTTGAFTAIGAIGPGSGIDPGTGSATTAPLNDVDSLSINPFTGEMWGITQDSSHNKIFRINLATGAVIPDTFGPGLDYAEILLPATLTDTDDLGIDPTTGVFYFVANTSGGDDHLYRLNIDGINPASSPGLNATLGTMTSTEVGQFELAGFPGTFITDMEGFSFYNDGSFYGTTGEQGGVWSNRMWKIDTATGQVTQVTPGPIDNDGVAPNNGDFEGVACLSAGSNIKSGLVFDDLNRNGVFDGTDTPYSSATVRFYRDNGNGTFDGAPTDGQIQTAVTGANGVYTFEVASEGTFFAVVDPATLPAGTALTTVGRFTVNFVDFNNSLTSNNFGFGTPPEPEPLPTSTPVPTSEVPPDPVSALAPAQPLLTKRAQPSTVIPGEQVTFTLTASNPSAGTLTDVVITDTFDATFFDKIVELSATRGTTTLTGPLTITAAIGTLAPGETVTVTILANVRVDLTGPKSTENVAVMTSREHDPVEARATVTLIVLPTTGYPPDPLARGTSARIALFVVMSITLISTALWTLMRRRRVI
jgi:uncharacterized repeat protein (TIGR01451 family)